MNSAAGPGSVEGDGGGRGTGAVVPRPVLLGRLGGPARVTVVSASAGSGKTVLLRSWLGQEGLDGRAAWVPAGRGERDPQRFWASVAGALRRTSAGAGLVQGVSVAPDLDAWALVERLLADLAPLDDRLWLVIDDVHELDPEASRQLELLVMRAPPQLRFVLAARHDVRLGLHRLRLEGELAEIRANDLKFTLEDAGHLLAAAGVQLPGPALAALHGRTEGWAAGLRLAALALAGHPDPARLAAQFSGTERTVAEYLLAEVLDRQPEKVRRLLLRTSILERVNGDLAHLLTGDDGGERVLQDLEQAGAFVVSLDAERSWFRYHQMFADLLLLELRRTAPGEVTGLHAAASGWFARHGYPAEAIRHAQAARDWGLAARLLADHWPGLHLDGQDATIHELLAEFPAALLPTDAELAVIAAADELARGSLQAADRYLALAGRASASAPEARRGQLRLLLEVARLLLARQRGDLPTATEEASRLQAITEAEDATQPGLIEDLRALALISLGNTEFWAFAWDAATRHLESGIALARRIGRPYLEFTGLAYLTPVMNQARSFTRGHEVGREAAELAERHGWTDDPAFGLVSNSLGVTLAYQGRLEEADRWLQSSERTLRAEAVQPATAAAIRMSRGVLELMRNRDSAALAAFQASEELARWPGTSPHHLIPWIRGFLVLALVRLGQTGQAGQFLDGLSDADREHGEVRVGEAALRLATGDPRAAAAALAPVLDGSAPVAWQNELAQAYVLEAIARDSLGDQDTAHSALERALDLAEPDGLLLPFLLHPAPGLLDRHARHLTAHASLLAEVQDRLSGTQPSPRARPRPLLAALSESEIRVLRYLPTNLTVPEIARELYVSPNTVRTHVKSLYAKLGTHHRTGAVERARTLGLLAPAGTGRANGLGGRIGGGRWLANCGICHMSEPGRERDKPPVPDLGDRRPPGLGAAMTVITRAVRHLGWQGRRERPAASARRDSPDRIGRLTSRRDHADWVKPAHPGESEAGITKDSEVTVQVYPKSGKQVHIVSSISIIGPGAMARILGTRALAGGNTVEIIGRDAAKAAALARELDGGATAGTTGSAPAGDIVILAVPYAAAVPVVSQYGDVLTGKIIIDVSNPFDPAGTGLVTPDGSSAAQQTAEAATAGAHVVKAFNTLFGEVLAADKAGGRPLDVFIAGDDAPAKARVSAFIESLAMRPLDVGDLRMAHWLEGAGLLMVAPGLGKAFNDYDFWLGINTLG